MNHSGGGGTNQCDSISPVNSPTSSDENHSYYDSPYGTRLGIIFKYLVITI